jgi:hypothetical protein
MAHAGAGPVRQDQASLCIVWTLQQSGNAVCITDADRYGFYRCVNHVVSMVYVGRFVSATL